MCRYIGVITDALITSKHSAFLHAIDTVIQSGWLPGSVLLCGGLRFDRRREQRTQFKERKRETAIPSREEVTDIQRPKLVFFHVSRHFFLDDKVHQSQTPGSPIGEAQGNASTVTPR